MSDQYTPSIASAQAYLTTLHAETITRQDQEIVTLRRKLAQAQAMIVALSNQIRDLELDLTMMQPREVTATKKVSGKLTKTEQVRRLAVARGISVSTAWRRVQSGEEKLED